jgi:hypothetical protein
VRVRLSSAVAASTLLLAGCPRSASDDAGTTGAPDAATARPDSEAQLDRGRIDPTCEGLTLSLLEAAADDRCAIDAAELVALAPADAGPGLRQIARREGEGVLFFIANLASAPVDLPVRFQSTHPERAFSVIAEDERGRVFELVPPRLRLEGSALDGGVRTARIRLPPGGKATVGLTIEARVTRRLDVDGGSARVDAGVSDRLPKGSYVLHIGQLLTDRDTGAPARVSWLVP